MKLNQLRSILHAFLRSAVSVALTVILTQIVTVQKIYAVGGKDGGGGNVCRLAQDKLRVLDLVGRQSRFERVFNSTIPKLLLRGKVALDRDLDQKFDIEIAFSKFGYIDIHDRVFTGLSLSPVVGGGGGVKPLIRELGKYSDEIASKLNWSIDNLRFFAVPEFPEQGPIGGDFSESEQCSPENTTAAILYYWNIGIIINAKVWNELDTFNQTALIIHEAIRNIQIRHGGNFSELELQRLTALVMTGDFVNFSRRLATIINAEPPTNPFLKQLCVSTNPLSNTDLRRTTFVSKLYTACMRPTSENLYHVIRIASPESHVPYGVSSLESKMTQYQRDFLRLAERAYLASLGRDSSTEEKFDPFFGFELMGVQQMTAATLGLEPDKDFFSSDFRRRHYNTVREKFHNAFEAAFRDAKQ